MCEWVELYLYSPYMPSWRGQGHLFISSPTRTEKNVTEDGRAGTFGVRISSVTTPAGVWTQQCCKKWNGRRNFDMDTHTQKVRRVLQKTTRVLKFRKQNASSVHNTAESPAFSPFIHESLTFLLCTVLLRQTSCNIPTSSYLSSMSMNM